MLKFIGKTFPDKKQYELNAKCRELSQKSYEAASNGDTDLQIDCLEKAVALKTPIFMPNTELIRLYKKLKRPEDELRVCLFTIEQFSGALMIEKRIRELQGKQPEIKKPTCRLKINKEGKTWGDMFFEKWNRLTKDDFYLEKEEFEEYNEEENYIDELGKETNPPKIVIQYRLCLKDKAEKELDSMIDYLYNNQDVQKAKEAESVNDYMKALEYYENIAAEQLPYSDYYGHIAIYKKFRLREAELEAILELKTICQKEEERYNILKNRFIEWFPQSAFATDYKEGMLPSIGYLSFPPIKITIYKELEKRISWLQDKIGSKA